VDAALTWQNKLTGIVATFSAVTMWAWYSVFSARFVKRENLSVPLFNSLVGIVCLLITFFVGSFLHLSGISEMSFLTGELHSEVMTAFLVGMAILGLVTAMAGTFFWQHALKLIPTSIVGQLIVCEPLFGLLFSFLVIGRFPTLLEHTGASVVVFAVLYFIRSVRNYQQQQQELLT